MALPPILVDISCIITSLFSKAYLSSPDDRMKAAIDAAKPTQIVMIFGFMYFIVSNSARPAVTEPPGEFM